MTKQEMKNKMQAVRATYAGTTRKLDAYKKNLERINCETYKDRKAQHFLHLYNESFFS